MNAFRELENSAFHPKNNQNSTNSTTILNPTFFNNLQENTNKNLRAYRGQDNGQSEFPIDVLNNDIIGSGVPTKTP